MIRTSSAEGPLDFSRILLQSRHLQQQVANEKQGVEQVAVGRPARIGQQAE
jgi:hypothetical protein